MFTPSQVALYAGAPASPEVLTHTGVVIDVTVSGSTINHEVLAHTGVVVDLTIPTKTAGGSGQDYLDDFNRADAGSLGADWTAVNGTMLIEQNEAYFGDIAGAGQLQRHRYDFASDTDDVRVGVDNTLRSVGGYCDHRIMARWDHDGTFTTWSFYELRIDSNGDAIINRVVGGTETDIGTVESGMTYSLPETWEMEITGTNPVVIEVFRNGVSVGSVNDSDATRIQVGSMAGIGGFTAGGSPSDVRMDNFTFADAGAGGGTAGADTLPVARAIAHTGVTVDVTVSSTLTETGGGETVTHTGVAVDLAVAATTAPGAITIAHTSVAVEVAPTATTAQAFTAAHTGVTVEVAVAATTAPAARAVAHTGVAVNVAPTATTGPSAATLAHTGVAINVAVGLLTISQGDIVVTIITGDLIVGLHAGDPFASIEASAPISSLVVKEPILVP